MKIYHKQTCLPLWFSKIQALSLSFLLLFAGNLFLSAQSIKGRVYASMFSFTEGVRYGTEQF